MAEVVLHRACWLSYTVAGRCPRCRYETGCGSREHAVRGRGVNACRLMMCNRRRRGRNWVLFGGAAIFSRLIVYRAEDVRLLSPREVSAKILRVDS